MKLKTKLIASIMSICLVCAVFAIGVFALKTANLKIGGNVSFTATGVEAHIKNAKIEGAVTPTELDASDEEGKYINTSMTQTSIDNEFDSWQNLFLDFDENATDIVFSFDIANTASNVDNYIEIDYSYSFSNSSPNVDVFPGDENDEGTWENNEYILTPKGSAETATYETFTLKFKVLDKELNVPQDTKVNLTIALKHTTPVEVTLADGKLTTPDGIIYRVDANGTASLGSTIIVDEYLIEGDNYSYDGDADVVIAPVVSDGTNNYIVTVIDSCAFYYCNGEEGLEEVLEEVNEVMQTIHIPNSVKEIKEYAFYYCRELVSANIPKSVTSIGNGAFFECTGLTSITIPSSVTSIGVSAFNGCSSLTTITIPSSVTSIGDSAFYNCSSLTTITIPSSVTSIGDSAFYNCSSLTTITIPSGVTNIGERAFEYCSSLTSITIQNGVTSIGSYAFDGCDGLTTITIPSSVTSIGSRAFYNCSSLTTITIPSSVTSIGDEAFSNTAWYNNQPNGLIYINNVLYEYKGTMPEGTSIEVKEGTVSISGRAFRNCSSLTSITIPSGVTSIGDYAFYNCSSLTAIIIPSSVTSIEWYAFSACTNLTSVKFEETTGWAVAATVDGERTPIAESEFTTDASAANANLLKSTYNNKYWFRTVE